MSLVRSCRKCTLHRTPVAVNPWVRHMCRYYSPDRDMELVHQINPHPSTWEDYLKTSGFDGTQSADEIRAKFA